jgi:hypothetical protein
MLKPPSSATSFGEIPSRLSSAIVSGRSVSSPGFPTWVAAGRISRRAPRLVFSVTSKSWFTYPNSFGFPSLPLRIGRASGSEIDTSRSLIGSPATRCLICPATFSHRSASSSSCAAAFSFAFAPRPRARRRAIARDHHQPPRLRDRRLQQLARVRGQREYLGLRFPGATTDRAGHRPQRATHRPRAIPHPPLVLLDQLRELATFPGHRPNAVRRQARIGRILHVRLDHRRIDPW